MPTNIFDMTDAWNNPATTFNAIKMNVINASGAADSKIIDLQVGGLTRFNIDAFGKAVVRGELITGIAGGNAARVWSTPPGGQFVIYGVDPASSDPHVNAAVIAKGGGGVLLYSNDALQLAAAGPPGTTHYIQATGSVSGNPQISAGGGGRVEINDLLMTGNPEAPSPLASSDGNFVATTHFVKQFKYVQAAPPTTFNQLAGFADPPDGTLIQGIDMPAAGLKKVGPVLLLTDDLGALEALDGVNTIYYRSGTSTWTPVVVGPSLSFTGGTLDVVAGGGVLAPAEAEYITASSHGGLLAERVLTDTATITWDYSTPGQVKATSVAGGGNVSNDGTPAAGSYARWTTATTIEARTPSEVLSDIGAQSADPTLAAIAGLNTMADQMILFTGADAAVMTSVTPFARTLLDDANAPLAIATLGAAPLDSPNFFGQPTAPSPPVAENSIRVATTAFVKGQGYVNTTDAQNAIVAYAQPKDADLTALAALTGTNTIYYRSGTDAWSPVTIGGNMTFTGGVLNSTATGSGNVINVGTPAVDELAQWTDATHIKGLPIATHRTNAKFTGTVEIAQSGNLTTTNGWRLQGAAPGGNPTLSAQGPDADVGFFFSSKGNGGIYFYNGNFSRFCLALASAPGSNTFGTMTAQLGYWILGSNPANSPIYMSTNELHVTDDTAATIFRATKSGATIKGTNVANNAAAGIVGEYKEVIGSVNVAGGVGVVEVANIVLEPGDWDVTLNIISTGIVAP